MSTFIVPFMVGFVVTSVVRVVVWLLGRRHTTLDVRDTHHRDQHVTDDTEVREWVYPASRHYYP